MTVRAAPPRPDYIDDDDPAFPARLSLERAQDLLDSLGSELQRAKRLMDMAYEQASADGSDPKDRQRYFNASQVWSRLIDQFSREQQRVEAMERDQQLSAAWQQEADDLAAHLTARYERYGPHYILLCQSVAPLVIKLRKSYSGGIRLTPSEQTDLLRAIMQIVGQLQKHTESTKTEAGMSHDIATRVLKVVEAHLVQQPNTWAEIVQDVRKQLSAGNAAEGG